MTNHITISPQTDPQYITSQQRQIASITKLMSTTYPPLKPSPFQFKHTHAAASHNSKILAAHNFDLSKTLHNTTMNTHLQYGSKFRPPEDLEQLLQDHPLWLRTKKILEQGSTMPLEAMTPEMEKEDLLLGIERGNHKGATSQRPTLDKLVSKDIEHGFAMPISLDTAKRIKDGRWAPLNIQEQWTIDEKGGKMMKKRLTHDQSFPGLSSNIAINDQLQVEKLEPLIYGFMFIRLLHMIHAMRLAFPTIAILLCKFDLDAAYRRMHMHAATAAKCICTTSICALIYLRLTFGAAFSPAEWCIIIELITDLSMDIINNPLWVPSKLHSPIPEPSTIPPPKLYPSNTPFAPALPVDVTIQLPRHGWVDSYIDDLVGVCLHIKDNAKRTSTAILLSIYLLARPFCPSDIPANIIHHYILSAKKWLAEGQQEETKIVLGWFIDTRKFLVAIPLDKYNKYKQQIVDTLKAGKTNNDNLMNMIGRLQRCAYVIPHSSYFMNRLRHLQRVTEHKNWANLSATVKTDLELWLVFLKRAHEGTSINNLVFRKPSHFFWADSCPFGLGGYSSSGRAWRFYIPPHLRSIHTNNVLEYMAIIITIWIDADEGLIPPLSCCLGCSDNTSGVGWLHRSNFDPVARPVHEDCSRHLAYIMMSINSTLYSQHQKGEHNDIADLLSRWFFLTNIELTLFLKHKYNTQMPTSFHIYPLSNKINSWIISSLEKLRTTTRSRMQPTTTKQEHGNDGSPGWKQWAAHDAPTLLGLGELRKSKWSEPLRSLCAGENTVLHDTRSHWSLAQLQRPSAIWQRPFRTTTKQTPASPLTAKQTDTSPT